MNALTNSIGQDIQVLKHTFEPSIIIFVNALILIIPHKIWAASFLNRICEYIFNAVWYYDPDVMPCSIKG